MAGPTQRSSLLLAAVLAVACGSRADYELLHLRELVRSGDLAAVRAQAGLMDAEARAEPRVRELLLASELEALGLSWSELIEQLPRALADLPAAYGRVAPGLLAAEDRRRLLDLAEAGLRGEATSTSRRLEGGTLLLVGLGDHRDGEPGGLGRCLAALHALALEPDLEGARVVLGRVARRAAELDPAGAGGEREPRGSWREASARPAGAGQPAASLAERAALAELLEATP